MSKDGQRYTGDNNNYNKSSNNNYNNNNQEDQKKRFEGWEIQDYYRKINGYVKDDGEI